MNVVPECNTAKVTFPDYGKPQIYQIWTHDFWYKSNKRNHILETIASKTNQRSRPKTNNNVASLRRLPCPEPGKELENK